MTSPTVSVIVATHRRPHWLGEALDSVANQNYTPLQVIVVEDGADRPTGSVIAARDLPVLHLAMPHCGLPGRVRNHGLAHATGEFVAFLDDDDRWERGKLARQIDEMRANDRAPACFTSIRSQHNDGSVSGALGPPRRASRLSTRSALLGGCFIFTSSVLVRRAALDAAGGFDETTRSGEDYALWLRLSRDGDFLHIDEPLVTMRRHGTGLSAAPPAEIWTNTIVVLEAERRAGNLTIGDRLRLRRVMALGFKAVGRSLPSGSRERRRHLWRAFRLNPLQW